MLLRAMRETDLPTVAELAAQLGYEVEERQLQERLAKLAGSAGDCLCVAEHESRVVGWAHARSCWQLETAPHAELVALVVDANTRRLGVGRALVAEVLEWARAAGLPTLRVRSNVKRVEAHTFYPALGFTLLKTQHIYGRPVGDPPDAER